MKQLFEDSTAEKAIEAMSQWRNGTARDEFLDQYMKMEKIVTDMMSSPDVKDLLVKSIAMEMIGGITGVNNPIEAAKLNFTSGIIIGFKYAMYLHEQRELASLETIVTK